MGLQKRVYINAEAMGHDNRTLDTGGAYADGTGNVVNCSEHNQLILYIQYAMGSGESSNSLQVRMMFFSDRDADPDADTTAYQETSVNTVSGTGTVSLKEYTFSATQSAGTDDNIRLAIPITDHSFRVDVKETGIATNGGNVDIRGNLYSN